jgi:hypothetical protein
VRVQVAGLAQVPFVELVQEQFVELVQAAAAGLSPQQHRLPRRVSEKFGDLTHCFS